MPSLACAVCRVPWPRPGATLRHRIVRTLHSSALCPLKLHLLHAGRSLCSVLFFHSFLLGRMNPLRARNTSLTCLGGPPLRAADGALMLAC
jgi:hypothetical protein